LIKEYIRIEEMKELFTLVPLLENMKLSLDADLKRIVAYKKDEDDYFIEGMTFNNFGLSDMPHSNTNAFHSSTEDGALNYKQAISDEEKAIRKAYRETIREIYYIEVVSDKIKIGLNALTELQRDVLKLKYWQNNTWNEIIDFLSKDNRIFYSKRHIQRFTNSAIDKLKTIALIDMEMYKNVKLLINRTEQ
jgi:hypothetical protein